VLIPPAWLQIAAILARADEAECSVIRDIADVSDASLSKNLSGKQWRIGGISRFMSNGDHSANDPLRTLRAPSLFACMQLPMHQLMSFVRRLSGLAIVCFVLAACSSDDDAPDYRYRLTVEVDTPKGVKTGSSVIEVKQRLVRSGSNPAGSAVERRVEGEAVAVDLPGGKTLFALLRSKNNVDWASYVMQTLAPHIERESFAQQLDNMLLLEGEIVLPRTFSPVGHLEERSAYPMLVTFGDLDDPTSIGDVDPDDLKATFGDGYALRRITVQITDDAVTTGNTERLRWLGNIREMGLEVEDFPEGFPVGDLTGLFRK